LAMAIHPKVDKPYMFGLHQCAYGRDWTSQEERLFREIGRRLSDALTSLLVLRDLQESEARLEEAQRIAHVGYWGRDLDTDHISWSDEACRIFGLDPRDRLVDFRAFQEIVHPEDRQRIAGAVTRALRGGPRYDVEYRLLRPSGEIRIVHSQGDIMRDGAGQPLRMFGTVQDITDRVRAENELRESERRYRDVQMELAHVNRVTTMGQLTASIAHEVNQPIAATVANAQAALGWLDAAPPDLAEVRDALDRIAKDGVRAGAVVSRIHALIKKKPVRKDRLDVNEIIREVIALTANEVRRNGVTLEARLAPELPSILGDRVQLQQVILNLIVNAIEAMDGVGEEARALAVSTDSDRANGVHVTVVDSGPGLTATNLDRLFEAFYTTKPTGLGMGLSICRSIIEGHGGRVWASPNTPQGAVFQFILPAADARP
ncbi:MAG: sensor histidine kinase, partial [Candidatus Eiseniibacteriota bacterium]